MNKSNVPNQSPMDKLLDLIKTFFTQLVADKLFFQINLNIMIQPKSRVILRDLIKERSSYIRNSVQSIFEQIDYENSLANSYLLPN